MEIAPSKKYVTILICNGKNATTSKNSINISSCNWVFLLVSVHCGISPWCPMGSTYWLFVYLLGPPLWILWLKSEVTYCSLYYVACFFLFFLFFFFENQWISLHTFMLSLIQVVSWFWYCWTANQKKEVSWIHCFTISFKDKKNSFKKSKII